MAITKCKECGREVSSRAKTCPHCGIKNPGLGAKELMVGAFTALFIIAALSMCSTGNSEPPKTIQEISKNITAVQNEQGVLRISLAGGSVLRVKDVMQNASMDSYRIAENLVKHFSAQLGEKVIFVAHAQVADKFGKPDVVPAFELQYSVPDLKKVAFDSLYHRGLLELAAPIKYHAIAGAEIVVEWCKDEGNRSEARRFCATNAR